MNLPKQMRAVFGVKVELNVSSLVDEVDSSVAPVECTRAQSAHIPSAHAVGTSAEISFFIGKNGTVSVGIGNTKTKVERQRVLVVQSETLGDVKVALDILCIGNIK